jgi:hypothetical protein
MNVNTFYQVFSAWLSEGGCEAKNITLLGKQEMHS